MRVLIVCSANSGRVSPFVSDQVEHLQKEGLAIEIFAIKGKGFTGYLKNRPRLLNSIDKFKPDLIHAHSGMSALLSVLQRKVPVMVTFHGTDINNRILRLFSRIAMLLSHKQVVVSRQMAKLLRKPDMEVLPCGVDTAVFYPVKRDAFIADPDNSDVHILFSSSFENPIKNYALAEAAVKLIEQKHQLKIKLHPLENMSRQEVAMMMNTCHVCLMTSVSEGSPQFIKEALACGTPVVSTEVGDVKELMNGINGCYICEPNKKAMADGIMRAIEFAHKTGKTNGPARIHEAGLESQNIARKLISIYKEIVQK